MSCTIVLSGRDKKLTAPKDVIVKEISADDKFIQLETEDGMKIEISINTTSRSKKSEFLCIGEKIYRGQRMFVLNQFYKTDVKMTIEWMNDTPDLIVTESKYVNNQDSLLAVI